MTRSNQEQIELARTLLADILPDLMGLNDGEDEYLRYLQDEHGLDFSLSVVAAYDRKGYRNYGPVVGDTSPYRTSDANIAVQLSMSGEQYHSRIEKIGYSEWGDPELRDSYDGEAIHITVEFPRSHPLAERLVQEEEERHKQEQEQAKIARREQARSRLNSLKQEMSQLEAEFGDLD